MRRKMKKTPSYLITAMLILMLILCLMGVGYASWVKNLNVSLAVHTGSMKAGFDSERPYSVQIVDSEGTRVSEALYGNDINCRLMDDDKKATILLNQALLAEELAVPDRMLMLQYPLEFDAESTVETARLYQTDYTLPSAEQVAFEPLRAILTVAGMEGVLPWPSENATLYFNVYRQIETIDEQLIGTMFLKLTGESAALLAHPATLTLDAADISSDMLSLVTPTGDSTGFMQGELDVEYTFSVPLYIEQGHM